MRSRLILLKRRKLFKHPNQRVRWWPCAGMTVLVKRNQSQHPLAVVAPTTGAMASQVLALKKVALETKQVVDLNAMTVLTVKNVDLA
jgi:hypothetical protein